MMLKKLLPLCLICVVIGVFEACKKDNGCSPNPPHNESAAMLAYANANSMNVTADASGLYYEILDSGYGAQPNLNSKIFVTYVCKTLDGTLVDQQTSPGTTGLLLSGLIEGWRIGIPLIKKGGHIQMIVPSALAYGCQPRYGLPGNSSLFFDINLVDVQ